MCFQPGLALGRGLAVPGVRGRRRMGGQVAPQGVEAYLPVVQRVEGASPAGAVGAVDAPIGDCGAVADGAQRGDGEPIFGPGVLVPSDRTWAAGSEVVQDQGDGRTGSVRGPATVAGAVTADVMDGTAQGNDVPGTACTDWRRGNGEGEDLA